MNILCLILIGLAIILSCIQFYRSTTSIADFKAIYNVPSQIDASGQVTRTASLNADVGGPSPPSQPVSAPNEMSLRLLGNQIYPVSLVEPFAPILKFDRDAKGYPMSGQKWINDSCGSKFCQNTVLDTVNNPVYWMIYSYRSDTDFDVHFWEFYGYQVTCSRIGIPGFGTHNGDWERITVHVKNGITDSVAFWNHDGHYTTVITEFEQDEQHPIVYISQTDHASFSFPNPPLLTGDCGYYSDKRYPGKKDSTLETWKNLISLNYINITVIPNATFEEPWIRRRWVNKLWNCTNECGAPGIDCGRTITTAPCKAGDPTVWTHFIKPLPGKSDYMCDSCGCNWESCKTELQLFQPKCITC